MNKLNFSAFYIIGLSIFISIVYKILSLPITHDEVATAIHYSNFNIWEIMMFPDNWPNNHILNTLLSKLFINIFGNEVWVIRIPSLLSYFIYVFSIYRIVILFFNKKSLFIVLAISLFLTNPYLLDFFGLCRGYAMTSALVTLSSSYLIEGFIKNKDLNIWLAIIFSILASYANFTALIFWSSITILTCIYFYINYKKSNKKLLLRISLLAFLSISYLALIITPLRKMTSTNQFEYWSSKGFYKETILSLVENWKYNDKFLSGIGNDFFGILVVIIFTFALKNIIKKWIIIRSFNKIINDKLTLSFLIFSITILVNLIQIMIMNTPNINGRIALFLYPLYIILIIALLSEFETNRFKYLKYFIAIVIPLFLIYHLINSYQSESVREWWYDSNNLEVIDFLKKSNPNSVITLKTQWWFYPSFSYYSRTGELSNIKLAPNEQHEIEPDTKAEYYYIFNSEVKKLEPNFKKIKRFGWDRWLMKRYEKR